MIRPYETPPSGMSGFDEAFFDAYEQELLEVNIADQASAVLADIMKLEQADGSQKSYEDLRSETQIFFAHDWMRGDEAVMDRMAMEFAQACLGHMHGAELAQDGPLSSVFDRGAGMLGSDDHNGHSHDSDDETGTDPKTGKKKKKKKKWSWFGVYY